MIQGRVDRVDHVVFDDVELNNLENLDCTLQKRRQFHCCFVKVRPQQSVSLSAISNNRRTQLVNQGAPHSGLV